MQLVWFKRDLRVEDHAPLIEASLRGPVCCLYVYEPMLLDSDEWDRGHSRFVDQCLEELDRRLKQLGSYLCRRHGDIVRVLHQLHHDHPLSAIWSHEETGNALTFQRDKDVAAWSKQQGVPWHELPQFGVVRRLPSRDGWQRRWGQYMNQELIPAPTAVPCAQVDPGPRLAPERLVARSSTMNDIQVGGITEAQANLESFYNNAVVTIPPRCHLRLRLLMHVLA